MAFRFSAFSSASIASVLHGAGDMFSFIHTGAGDGQASATSSSSVSGGLATGQHLGWTVQSFASEGTGSLPGAPTRATVIGGGPASGLEDVLAATEVEGAFVFNGTADPAVSATPDPDIFVYEAGSGSRTIHGFDMSEDRLILLGVPEVRLMAAGADTPIEVHLDDGSVILLHLASSSSASDPFGLG